MAQHPTRRLTRPLALAALIALSVVSLAACGDDDAETGDTTSTTASADTTSTTSDAGGDDYGGAGGDDGTDDAVAGTVVAEGFAFTAPASVAAGSTVTFDNQDSATHTLTADDGEFDSGSVSGGSRGEITAPTAPGDYAFHCEIHPSMTGTLTVE